METWNERNILKKMCSDRFPSDVSAKVLAIARLYARGSTVFGDQKKFMLWMDTENIALSGHKPKSYIDLIEGINLIMDELTAIEHGFVA